MVDLIGTMYEDDVIATGFGNYVCLPLLRKAGNNLTKDEAKKVLEDCMRVLFYRNCRSSTKVIFFLYFGRVCSVPHYTFVPLNRSKSLRFLPQALKYLSPSMFRLTGASRVSSTLSTMASRSRSVISPQKLPVGMNRGGFN